MKRKVSKRDRLRLVRLVLAIAFILAGIIPGRIAIAFYQAPIPQAILVLGSASERMEFAAQFWHTHSHLDIWVSDYAWNLDVNRRIFQSFGVPNQRLHLDGRATDTVTNFTTLVEDFVSQKLQHIYLITSDYHMNRARAIASIVFGSQGIVLTPVEVPSQGDESETLVRVLRDCGRSLLWIFTNRTGASLNPKL
ncbi:YdcF family protein [Scytonema hofmannii FACHB-248]|uniref:YdcF family protein n=1 Tax=Scytonema hofmannii FACHB-248 TaxID=1842502 RepID=A0ABR8H1R8_9CYAN|nr:MULTISPECIES: YdcF family protein [Nostocales]MBD2609282.1 YdcF family protein [Scytonema hofmannii FACHB-248]